MTSVVVTPRATLSLGRAVSSQVRSLADVLGIAASPRFRVSQRHRLLAAARLSMLLIIALGVLDCFWIIPSHPTGALPTIIVNGSTVMAAVIGYSALRGWARRRPEVIILITLAVVDMATLALAAVHPDLALIAAGYLLLLPMIVALMIPWPTRFHVTWLVVQTIPVILYASVATQQALVETGQRDLLGLLVVATAISLFGHLTLVRAQVGTHIQLERVHALNRHARRVEARLDRLVQVLESSSRTDELTGLQNRLSLKMDLAVVRSQIARHDQNYGYLVIDLDRFKRINDTFGHVAGDHALVAVAAAIRAAVRPIDGCYRYGGEEFVVLLQVDQPSDALVAAERIRRAVEALDLVHPGNPPHHRMTVCVGTTTVGPMDLDRDDDAWFGRADEALYRAKAAGRNRSVVAAIPGAPTDYAPGLAQASA